MEVAAHILTAASDPATAPTAWTQPLMRGHGVVVLIGAALLGLLPWLQQTRSFTLSRGTSWPGLRCSVSCSGWAGRPGVGPTLNAVPSLRVTGGSVGRGALLAFGCCQGVGIPFALATPGLGWVSTALAVHPLTRPRSEYRRSRHAHHARGPGGHRCLRALDLPVAKSFRNLPHPRLIYRGTPASRSPVRGASGFAGGPFRGVRWRRAALGHPRRVHGHELAEVLVAAI